MMITTWGEKYKKSGKLPPQMVLEVIQNWLEGEVTVIFNPLLVRSTLWLLFVKPDHFSHVLPYSYIMSHNDHYDS